jgi:hypothetical protein
LPAALFGSVLLDGFVVNRRIGIPMDFDHEGIFGKAVYPKLMIDRLNTGRERRLEEGQRDEDGGSSLCLS